MVIGHALLTSRERFRRYLRADARRLKDENAKLTAMLCGMIRGIERVGFDLLSIYDAEAAGVPASELKIWWWHHKQCDALA
jgi:hypothetical protein